MNEPSPNPPAHRPLLRRPLLRRSLVALVVAVLVAVFHAPLLTLVAHGVVAPRWDGPVDHVLVIDGDMRYDQAAARYRDGRARSVVLLETPPSELVKLGILPPRESLGTRLLTQNGVPPEAIGTFARLWADLRVRLAAHPDETWLLVVTQFRSRELRRIAAKVLGEDAERLRWLPDPDANFDTTNWWRDRDGIKDLATAYLALGWEIARGSRPEPSHPFDPDAWLAEYRASRGF